MATIKLNTSTGNIVLLTDDDAEKIITLGTLEAFKELSDASYKEYLSSTIVDLKEDLSKEIADVQIKIQVEQDRGLLDGGVGDDNTIYFFPISDTSMNQYEEYIYYNSTWELLGAVDIADMENYVKNTLEINGHALSSDITLTATDVGAATQDDITNALSSYVLKTVTVNGHALSSDITLTATDVGALATGEAVYEALEADGLFATTDDIEALFAEDT